MKKTISLLFLTSFSFIFSQSNMEESTKLLYHIKQALQYSDQGDDMKAISSFNIALEISPNNSNTLYSRGNSWLKLSNFEKAIKDFSKAIDINPKFEDAYFNRGIAFKSIEKFNNAIRDFSKVIEINPEDANSYYHRGLMFGSLGESELACSDISMAKSLGKAINPSILNLCL